MKIFDNDNYKYISNFVESKIGKLRENDDFEKKYVRLFNEIEELEAQMTNNQKEKLNKIIELIHNTEEYYFALSYSLGVKYGEELKKI